MEIQLTVHALPFAGAAVVQALLLHIAWNNRRDPVARWFAATLAAMLVWSAGYCLEITAVELEAKLLFANLQFLGVATVSVCWWEMIRRHLELRRVPKALTAALWLFACITILMAFLNPYGLFRGTPVLVTGDVPFPLLHADYGPWYWWVLVPQAALINLAVLYLLATHAFRAGRLQRRQCALLFAALFVPLVGTGLYIGAVRPFEDYNPTVAISGFSGLLLALGLFRWRLFNMVFLAHDRLVENLADGVIIADRTGRVVDMNRTAERITGLDRRSVAGRAAGRVFAAYPALVEMLSTSNPNPAHPPVEQNTIIRRSDPPGYFALSPSPVTGRRGGLHGMAVIMHDITERVKLFEQVRHLANEDDLTGLPNRRHFFDLMSTELDRSARYHQPLSLLVFDVDRFKTINDSWGHRAGDEVLRELSQTCRTELRASDVIGRVGGEEFAVLLPQTGLEEALEVAERLRHAVRLVGLPPGSDTAGEPGTVTISVGAAQAKLPAEGDGPHETVDSLFERADRALYAAKEMGRDTVVAAQEPFALRAAI